MLKKVIYRSELLQAVDAFLEGTSSSHIRAQHIVQRCYAAIQGEEKGATLNDIIWGPFIVELTDSVFYKNEQFLRETREILRGHSSHNIARTIFGDDYHTYFTTDEENLYAQLLSMLDFIMITPFTRIHEATYQAWQNKTTWVTTRTNIPEAVQAEKIDREYMQRKALIEDTLARSSFPEEVGDEKIYHLVLREVTSILTAIRVGHGAISSGYPVLDGSYTDYRVPIASKFKGLDATESLSWARKSLDAIAGKGDLFISWRFAQAPTFDADLLLITLH